MTQNVQGIYGEEEMYIWKQHLNNEEADIVCITETHLNERREKIFRQVFEEEYTVMINSRSDMKKKDKGSGGVAIIARKKYKAVMIKRKTDGLL